MVLAVFISQHRHVIMRGGIGIRYLQKIRRESEYRACEYPYICMRLPPTSYHHFSAEVTATNKSVGECLELTGREASSPGFCPFKSCETCSNMWNGRM